MELAMTIIRLCKRYGSYGSFHFIKQYQSSGCLPKKGAAFFMQKIKMYAQILVHYSYFCDHFILKSETKI